MMTKDRTLDNLKTYTENAVLTESIKKKAEKKQWITKYMLIFLY